MTLHIPYGFPASGKGTQSKIMIRDPLFGIVGSYVLGDQFRSLAKADSSCIIAQLMHAGDLIPEEIVNPMVRNFFKSHIGAHNGNQSLLLDGFPRNIDQAKLLPKFRRTYSFSEIVIYHIMVPPEVCQARLIKRAEEDARTKGESRVDDRKLEVIDKRIADHGASARHVLPFLKEQEYIRVEDIEGNLPPSEVTRQIRACLGMQENVVGEMLL